MCWFQEAFVTEYMKELISKFAGFKSINQDSFNLICVFSLYMSSSALLGWITEQDYRAKEGNYQKTENWCKETLIKKGGLVEAGLNNVDRLFYLFIHYLLPVLCIRWVSQLHKLPKFQVAEKFLRSLEVFSISVKSFFLNVQQYQSIIS